MENKTNATETNAQSIATEEVTKVVIDDDLEARMALLEAENAKLIEEKSNYQVAYLKEKGKHADSFMEDEDEENKLRRIAREELANSRIAQLALEKDEIIKKALRENKELKLANMNRTQVPSSTGSHSEGQQVRDTLVTPEQIEAFKKRGWTDKDIERYKKNLVKFGGR